MAEAIGFAASVLQVAATCVKTVHALDTLRHKYKNAPDSIDALYSESLAISASLNQLKALIEHNDQSLKALRTKPELYTALQTAVLGCETVFNALSSKLDALVPRSGASQASGSFLGLKRRASFLWNQDLLKSYQTQIHGHQQALSLLLLGLQMHSLSDITSIVQETRRILTEMSQDQITLRGSPSQQSLGNSYMDSVAGDLNVDNKGCGDVEIDDLIDLRDAEPSDPNVHKEQTMYSSFADLSILQSRDDHEAISLSTMARTDASSFCEKRDSAQSTTEKVPTVVLPGASAPDQYRPTSEAYSPLSWDTRDALIFGHTASDDSFLAGASVRASSIQLEYPEVVPQPSTYPEVVSRSPASTTNPYTKVLNPPSWLPLSKEEQEQELLQRRNVAIMAHDVEIQLKWAEEALHFISINAMSRRRVSRTESQPIPISKAEEDLEREAKMVIQAQLHRSPKALFLQAMYFGRSPATSMELYKTSLANGFPRSAFYIAKTMELNPKNKKSAIVGYYKEGAIANDSACNYRLGEAYLNGDLGLSKSTKDAIWYLRKAAENPDQDFPQALFLLGILQTTKYRQKNKIKDSLLPIDDSAAREKFKRGALLGCSRCQNHLGHAFRTARLGCPNDPNIALHYFQLASRQGQPEADHQISTWFAEGEPGFIEKNPRLAFLHGRRAAEDGLPAAIAQVGYFYEHGIGVEADRDEAIKFYISAVRNGDEQAEKRLDALKAKDLFGVPKDLRKKSDAGEGSAGRKISSAS